MVKFVDEPCSPIYVIPRYHPSVLVLSVKNITFDILSNEKLFSLYVSIDWKCKLAVSSCCNPFVSIICVSGLVIFWLLSKVLSQPPLGKIYVAEVFGKFEWNIGMNCMKQSEISPMMLNYHDKRMLYGLHTQSSFKFACYIRIEVHCIWNIVLTQGN